jgi:glycosyltransferase involved in cell wall biosynthesis
MTAVVDASVIIPARDAAATLGAQLDALDAQRYAGTFEVIVADNGSKDATAEIVTRRLRSTDALRLVSVDGEGVSRARNVGASYASGPTLLFCDADDVVGGSWCDGMTAALSSNDAVGGAIDFAELSPEHESDGRLLRGLDRWPGYEPFAWGCNFGIRTEVFHTVGGFDESFAGCDDEEMSWRLLCQGYTVGFAPDAVVHYRMAPAAERIRKTFRYAMDEPNLYRRYRVHGMPSGPPMGRWLARLAKQAVRVVRHPGDAARRGELRYSTGRFFGCIAGSIKHRTWFLGRREGDV